MVSLLKKIKKDLGLLKNIYFLLFIIFYSENKLVETLNLYVLEKNFFTTHFVLIRSGKEKRQKRSKEKRSWRQDENNQNNHQTVLNEKRELEEINQQNVGNY